MQGRLLLKELLTWSQWVWLMGGYYRPWLIERRGSLLPFARWRWVWPLGLTTRRKVWSLSFTGGRWTLIEPLTLGLASWWVWLIEYAVRWHAGRLTPTGRQSMAVIRKKGRQLTLVVHHVGVEAACSEEDGEIPFFEAH